MADAKTIARPEVAAYDHYRDYLQDLIRYLKATDPKFSYRYFSRRAGYRSPNALKLVADGTRSLPLKAIDRFAEGLRLESSERDAFEELVRFSHARTDEERNRYYLKLKRRVADTSPTAHMEKAQYDVFSAWYALAVRELVTLPEFREDPQWIAARLRPRITEAQARRALELLETVGLLARDGDGTLGVADVKLTTPGRVPTLAVRNYHRSLLQISAASLDAMPVERRNLTSLTLALSRRQYALVCERIEAFRQELHDLIDDSPDTDEKRDVHVLGFQVVPVTRLDEP